MIILADAPQELPDLFCLTIADAAATDGRLPAAVYQGATRELLEALLGGQVEAAREAEEPSLLRGENVMAAFGLAPGSEVGRLRRRAREAQALGLVRSREEALAHFARDGPAPSRPTEERGADPNRSSGGGPH